MNEATYWRARYLELLQNHVQIVALMAQKDQAAEQAQALAKVGDALAERVKASSIAADAVQNAGGSEEGPAL